MQFLFFICLLNINTMKRILLGFIAFYIHSYYQLFFNNFNALFLFDSILYNVTVWATLLHRVVFRELRQQLSSIVISVFFCSAIKGYKLKNIFFPSAVSLPNLNLAEKRQKCFFFFLLNKFLSFNIGSAI